LRAPLRAIDGYIHMLVDDHTTSLDAEGLRLFSVVKDEARHMGDLINGLLKISRISYSELHANSPIDMEKMIFSVFNELVFPEDHEKVDFRVSAIPQAAGDSVLIRQVWTNLISNAIKFSSGRERPIICITATSADGEVIYAVNDNGVGFDMQYASKLFGVFRRLHSEREFPGMGIGLAIVQRIIQRHNGRVWVESELDQGTTFYFSLPHEKVRGSD
jgi:light-regulated signal transduction histidine kinase (bacteriophytochrome)